MAFENMRKLLNRPAWKIPVNSGIIIPEDEVVLTFGLIREYKGADLLIKSLAILKDKRPNLKVLIAGHCYHKGLIESYKDLAEKLRVADRVRFKIERIDDGLVASLFRAADLIALPYKQIDQKRCFGNGVFSSKAGNGFGDWWLS